MRCRKKNTQETACIGREQGRSAEVGKNFLESTTRGKSFGEMEARTVSFSGGGGIAGDVPCCRCAHWLGVPDGIARCGWRAMRRRPPLAGCNWRRHGVFGVR